MSEANTINPDKLLATTKLRLRGALSLTNI